MKRTNIYFSLIDTFSEDYSVFFQIFRNKQAIFTSSVCKQQIKNAAMNFDLTNKVLLLASAKYSWDFTKLKFIQQNCSTTRRTMHRGCAKRVLVAFTRRAGRIVRKIRWKLLVLFPALIELQSKGINSVFKNSQIRDLIKPFYYLVSTKLILLLREDDWLRYRFITRIIIFVLPGKRKLRRMTLIADMRRKKPVDG